MQRINKFTLLLTIVGTVALAVSLAWNLIQSRKSLEESARVQARMSFKKDVLYRLWNAQQGGVYVPVSEHIPPNPYLSFIPDRDVETTSGKHLTLVNPAYMTRLVFELGEKEYGLRSHITSLRPIRPENKADEWETEALKAFETGAREVSSLVTLDGKPYLRLMKPLITDKPCLRCHARHGYKEGDIRGGISVSVPMEPLLVIYRQNRNRVIGIHLGLWVGFLGLLYFGYTRFKKSEQERQQTLQELEERSSLIREAQEIARLGSYSLDIISGFWTSSEILDEIFGIGPDYERSVEGWVNIVHPEEQEAMLNYFQQEVLGKKQPFDRVYRIIRINDKEERWVRGLGKLEFNDDGEPIRMMGTVQDITEWRKIRAELAKATERDKQRLAEIQASLKEARQAQRATMNLMEDLTQEVEHRKKITEDLKAAQEYSQNLIDSSLDMIIAVDNQRKIIEFNHAAEKTFGYTKKEVIGKHINMLYASADQGRRVHRRTLELGQHVQEIINKRKNGETFPTLLAASTLTDKEGRVTGIMGVSRDITEQKKAQAALEARARQQAAVASLGERALIETKLERLFQYTTETVAKTLNVEFCKILELQPDGLNLRLIAGVGWKKGYIGKALVSVGKKSQAGYTLQTGRPVVVEDLARETRFSGPKLLTDHKVVSGLSTIIGRRKDPFGVLGAHTAKRRTFTKEDINFFNSIAHILGETIERQKAAQALRESEEEFRTLIATARDAIIGLDERGCISVWNRAATRLFGYTRQEALGQNLHDLIVPSRYRKKAHRGIRHFWKTGQGPFIGKAVELTGLRKDGTEFPIELSISKYRKGKSNYLYATGIVRDISERQRAEQEREILQRLSLRLTEPLTLQEIGKIVAKEARELFNYDAFSLESIDTDKGLLIGVYNEDTPEGESTPQPVPVTSIRLDQVANRVPLKGQAQLLNRKELPKVTQTNPFGYEQRLSWSLMYAPILWESKPIGILSVQSYTPNQYTKRDLTLLQTLANQLGGVFIRLKERQALEESEARFRGLVNTAPIGIAIHQEGKFVLVNDYMLKMTGYTREEIIGMPVLEILVPEQREQVWKRVQEMIRTGEPAPASEEHILTRDGQILYAMVAGTPITYQGKPSVEVSAIDITEIKKVERARRESEQKFRTFFENSRDVIYITT
ncbi:MAG: PAS domain S-box protein, partial [Fidelibacterota bacterium]